MRNLLIAAGIFLLPVFSANAETVLPRQITMAVDDYLPFVSHTGSSKEPPGYMVEIAMVIFSRHNIQLKLLNSPYGRSLELGQENLIDGMFAQRYRTGIFYPPQESYGSNRICMYGLAADTRDFSDISTQRIGLNYGYVLSEYASFADVQHLVETNSDRLVRITGQRPVERYIGLLRGGRIDSFIENNYVANWYFKKFPGIQVEAKRCSERRNIYVLLFHNYAHAAAVTGLLDEGIVQMRESGELATILARYGLQDWAPLTSVPPQ